ncbi:MAG: GtrA family protein [Hyphomicrobium sp.]|jgi:putative flippase GtrA
MNGRSLKYVSVGLFAALVNVVARLLFNQFASYEVAVALAFPVALTVAFSLNRNYVFAAGNCGAKVQYVKFAIVNLLALAQVWGVSVGLAKSVFPAIGLSWHGETIAHLIGVGSPIFTSYIAYKNFVFAARSGRGTK